MSRRVVLASASTARLATLRAAGIEPAVEVSGVDESVGEGGDVVSVCARLATAKAAAVAERVADRSALVLGCDSLLELGGRGYGKPTDAKDARRRWQQMRGRTAVLHTGHCVCDLAGGRRLTRVASTRVRFAAMSDAEVEAYVATGEPLGVAGGFTIDGLGGAFITGVDGDPHNVVGLSLPLLREMLRDLGVAWTDLWHR